MGIGGGHAFGKTHCACPMGAGPSPADQPLNPWPEACGTGTGEDAFTSGFEGPWTTKPNQYDDEFFRDVEQHLGKNHWPGWKMAVADTGSHRSLGRGHEAHKRPFSSARSCVS